MPPARPCGGPSSAITGLKPAVAGKLAAAAAVLILAWPAPGLAQGTGAGEKASQNENHSDFDSEQIFGITEGSDVGNAGEKEAEVEPFAAFGKRRGVYAATSTALTLKYTPIENFRVAPVISFASHNISNVPGLDDRQQFRFDGVGGELRYRLLDREHAPVGMTLSVLANRNNVDETTGLPVEQYGIEFAALLDRNLIPDRLFGALNVFYEPEWTRSRITGERERSSTIGIGAALSAQVAAGVFVAAEARYLRKYEGIGLNTLLGEALFVGPSMYLRLPKQWFFSVAWNVQVAGHAVGEAGSLDLTNFERHEVLLRAGFNF
jgi:hypothetical protein